MKLSKPEKIICKDYYEYVGCCANCPCAGCREHNEMIDKMQAYTLQELMALRDSIEGMSIIEVRNIKTVQYKEVLHKLDEVIRGFE